MSLRNLKRSNTLREVSRGFSELHYHVKHEIHTAHNDDTIHWLRRVLKSGPFHIAVVILTIVDIAIVFTSIMADEIAGGGEKSHREEEIHHKLTIVSLTIISVFMLEILVTMLAFGPLHYFHGFGWMLRLFDAVVICVGFSLELALHGEARDISGIILIFRLWRLFMIVTASLEIYNEAENKIIENLKKENKELRIEIAKLTGKPIPLDSCDNLGSSGNNLIGINEFEGNGSSDRNENNNDNTSSRYDNIVSDAVSADYESDVENNNSLAGNNALLS